MKKKIAKKLAFLAILLVFGGLGGIIADRYLFPYLSATKTFSKYAFLRKGSETITVINKTEQVTVKEETSISKITNQVSSSIVNIVSYQESAGNQPAKKTAVAKVAAKNGTGIIVTGDGMIMAYASGINLQADAKYKVMTYDGNAYDAALLGVDGYSNLAFLKINANNLSVASFGDSGSVKPGEKVIAVSNSFGSYANKYAAGLISDFNPAYNLAGLALSSSEKLEGVYETDFNYQKYFIGGPVVDYNGQVVGIVGVIEKDNAQSFFLIPSNKARAVIDRAVKKELDNNVFLGIYYLPISKTYAIENDINIESGALIYSASGQLGLAIIANSPAQKAGLKLGDIIRAVDGKEITRENPLSDLLYSYKKGDKMELIVLRDGQEIKVPVQL
ncbi:MAG: S1C family serine protease [Candidatus Moranbacteria bacterium]|nr:S1C family serine protease [Candidatus Moranbacteria bacterium]